MKDTSTPPEDDAARLPSVVLTTQKGIISFSVPHVSNAPREWRAYAHDVHSNCIAQRLHNMVPTKEINGTEACSVLLFTFVPPFPRSAHEFSRVTFSSDRSTFHDTYVHTSAFCERSLRDRTRRCCVGIRLTEATDKKKKIFIARHQERTHTQKVAIDCAVPYSIQYSLITHEASAS